MIQNMIHMKIEITDTVEFLEKCIFGIDKFIQIKIMTGWINYSLSKELFPDEKQEVLDGLKSVLMDKVEYQRETLISKGIV